MPTAASDRKLSPTGAPQNSDITKICPVTTPEAMQFSPIEAWENTNADRDYTITIRCPEFTAVCPMTGLPDFGDITVEYQPDTHVIELKAFKYYMLGYRNVGIFYENAVNKVRDDIIAAINPKYLKVSAVMTPRGGISTDVTVEYRK